MTAEKAMRGGQKSAYKIMLDERNTIAYQQG
jgi:hypothetical protein